MDVTRPRSCRGMITRAFTKTVITLICYDTESKHEIEQTVSLSGKYQSDGIILEKVRHDKLLSDGIIALSVKHREIEQELRAMSKETFIEHSKIITSTMEVENNGCTE